MKGQIKYWILSLVLSLSACAAPSSELSATPSQTSSPSPSPAPTATYTPIPSATAIPISALCSPLQDHAFAELLKYMTQAFFAPLGENREMGHHGTDFAYYRRNGTGSHIAGTPIQSVLDGYVSAVGFNPVYGYYLIVETPRARISEKVLAAYAIEGGQSLYLLYAHMQEEAPFNLGTFLECAQVVGAVGDSGDQYFVSDPHLHIETRVGPPDIQFGPMSFYDTSASEEEKSEYRFWRSEGPFILQDPMLLLNIPVE